MSDENLPVPLPLGSGPLLMCMCPASLFPAGPVHMVGCPLYLPPLPPIAEVLAKTIGLGPC